MNERPRGKEPLSGVVYLGLGSNVGNPKENVLQALQYLETRGHVQHLSSLYETDPVGYENQNPFCNAVCVYVTEDSPETTLSFLKWIEKRMGRSPTFRNGPRVIDLDILLWGDLVMSREGLEIPHPRMHQRSFVLVPFEEIAPQAYHPLEKKSVAELLKEVGTEGVRPLPGGLSFDLKRDVQQTPPQVPLGLTRVGVTGIRRIIRLQTGGGRLFDTAMDCFAHLPPSRSGVHMSRFSEDLEEVVQEIVSDSVPDLETLGERLALRIAQTQQSCLGEVHLRVNYPMKKRTPVSFREVEELYSFLGYAASDGKDVRRIVGVEAGGLTACPCAMNMVEEYSCDLLEKEGYSREEALRITELLPLASHNQRGRGTLLVGSSRKIRAEYLVHLVESSMSSEIYGLLKRPDEFFVVKKSHGQPRFVEDVVREMGASLLGIYPELEDQDFVLLRQENFESIHAHNAFAERSALVRALRQELASGMENFANAHVSMEKWLLDFPRKELP